MLSQAFLRDICHSKGRLLKTDKDLTRYATKATRCVNEIRSATTQFINGNIRVMKRHPGLIIDREVMQMLRPINFTID